MKLTDRLHYFLHKLDAKRRVKQRKNKIRKDFIEHIAYVVCNESNNLIYDSFAEYRNISFDEAKQICYDLKIPFYVDIWRDSRCYIYLDRDKLHSTK